MILSMGRYFVGALTRTSNLRVNILRQCTQEAKRYKGPLDLSTVKNSGLVGKALRVADSDWLPIYRFQLIRKIGMFNRLKIYQTIIVAIFVPIGYYSYKTDELSKDTLLMTFGALIVALFMLYVITSYTSRLIGVVSLSPDKQLVRIGYLSFFGFRRNALVEVENLVPLTDLGFKQNDLYVTLKKFDDDKFGLHLPMRKYEIVNPELFKLVFGIDDLEN